MKTWKAVLLVALALSLTACSRKPTVGYQPAEPAKDPLQENIDNWKKLQLVSGAFRAEFTFSDGDSQSVRADMLVQAGRRSVIELYYQTRAVAHVMITEEIINLLNHREKYFLREETTVHNARRLIGFPLLSPEIAALLSGQGFVPERFSQILPTANEEGSITVELWHKHENLRAIAEIDSFARLRKIEFIDTRTEQVFMRARYLEFRFDAVSGIVWPNLLLLDLLDRGEHLRLTGVDVDINNQQRLAIADRIFVRRERGPQLQLEDIPPGAPILYRNLKVYVEEDEK